MDRFWKILHILLHMEPSPEKVKRIRQLMGGSVNWQARDYSGYTLLHISVSQSRVQMTKMFLEEGAVDVIDVKDKIFNDTPLLLAARSRESYKLMLLLMEYGADVFARDQLDQNVLHRLSQGPEEQNVEVARILIVEKGVSLNDREAGNQYQPLHLAAQRGKVKLVKLYMDLGADVNAQANCGTSPLHLAARSENPEVLLTLLKGGANVHQKTSNGRTALHEACRNLHDGNIKVLLTAGADVLVEDRDGKTPFALMDCENVENPSVRLMVRLLALRKAIISPQQLIETTDDRIIEQSANLKNFYQNCVEQIERMKSTRFIMSCTFFDLLTKSQCQIAALMRNPKFETNFTNYDLTEFRIYDEDIVQAFQRAKNHYVCILEEEDLIDEAIQYTLPHMVVRRIAHYTMQLSGKCEMRNYY